MGCMLARTPAGLDIGQPSEKPREGYKDTQVVFLHADLMGCNLSLPAPP